MPTLIDRDSSIWTRPASDWKIRVPRIAKYLGGAAILALGMTLYIERSATMPNYAGVYLDDAAKTYIPFPCSAYWEKAPPGRYAVVQLSTVGNAHRLGYGLDDACYGKGYLSGTAHSLLVAWLVDAGVFPADVEWWDKPYRTKNDVVYPKRLPRG